MWQYFFYSCHFVRSAAYIARNKSPFSSGVRMPLVRQEDDNEKLGIVENNTRRSGRRAKTVFRIAYKLLERAFTIFIYQITIICHETLHHLTSRTTHLNPPRILAPLTSLHPYRIGGRKPQLAWQTRNLPTSSLLCIHLGLGVGWSIEAWQSLL